MKTLTFIYFIIFLMASIIFALLFVVSLFDKNAGYIPGISFASLVFCGLLSLTLFRAIENFD